MKLLLLKKGMTQSWQDQFSFMLEYIIFTMRFRHSFIFHVLPTKSINGFKSQPTNFLHSYWFLKTIEKNNDKKEMKTSASGYKTLKKCRMDFLPYVYIAEVSKSIRF